MFEYGAVGDAELVERLRDAERTIAVAQAEQLALIAELNTRAPLWLTTPDPAGGGVDPIELTAAEVGLALRLSRPSALRRTELALAVCSRLPATLGALGRGQISMTQLRVIAEATEVLSAEHAAAVERRVLTRAPDQTPAGLGASVARAVLSTDPSAAERRRQQAARERLVAFYRGPDGVATLWLRAPAAQVQAAYQRVHDLAAAARTEGDERSADARRADTLLDLILHPLPAWATAAAEGAGGAEAAGRAEGAGRAVWAGGAEGPGRAEGAGRAEAAGGDAADGGDDGARGPAAIEGIDASNEGDVPGQAGIDRTLTADPADRGDRAGLPPRGAGTGSRPRWGGGSATVHVTVAWTTLAGLDELPAELAGYGPITAEYARELASDATWRRLLTDPASGTVLDVGTTTYVPPAALAAHVRARDGTCRWPGCRRPALRCDLDHTVPHPRGRTASCNLGALCRGHHRLKTHTSWTVEQNPPGVFTWTSPTGQRVDTEPWVADAHADPDAQVYPEDAPAEPVDTDLVDTDLVDTDLVDTDLVDTDPVDTDPVDTDLVDTDLVDTDPVDTAPAGSSADPWAADLTRPEPDWVAALPGDAEIASQLRGYDAVDAQTWIVEGGTDLLDPGTAGGV